MPILDVKFSSVNSWAWVVHCILAGQKASIPKADVRIALTLPLK
jgi:hypothetical protein